MIVPSFLVSMGLAWAIAVWLKNKSEKMRDLPFQILAVALVLFEIAKQIYNYQGGEYRRFALPFHYCSLFVYIYPLHAFYKGKRKAWVDTLAFTCGASLFFFMLLMPATVYSESYIKNYFQNFNAFHSVTFHSYVCFYFFLVVAMKKYDFQTKRDAAVTAIFYTIYMLFIVGMAYLLDTNFHNVRSCNLAIVEEMRTALIASIGNFGQVIYVFVLSVLTVGLSVVAYFLARGLIALFKRWILVKK